jgi:hypothetical protein
VRISTLTLSLSFVIFSACGGDGGGGDGGTTTGTTGQDTGTSSTTVNPTTSASASATTGMDESTSSQTTTGATTEAGSSESGSMCPGGMSMDGMYGACQGPNMNYCPDSGQCLNIMGDGMGGDDYITCIRGCAGICNCWAGPEGDHTAEVKCDNFEFPDSQCDKIGANCSCFLDCSDGKTCPDGLECVTLAAGASLCALAVPPDPGTTGGTDSGTGDSGTGDTGTGDTGTGDSGTGTTGG